jgi:hypothetical protein
MDDKSSTNPIAGPGRTLSKVTILVLGGAIGVWVIVGAISIYIATLTPTMLTLWLATGAFIATVAVLMAVQCRLALLSLRLGVAHAWTASRNLDWLSSKRGVLWVEWSIWFFIAICLGVMVGPQAWSGDLGRDLLAGDMGLSLAAIATYWIGNAVSLDVIAEIKLDYWFIPLKNVHSKVRLNPVEIEHGAPGVPTIEIVWKEEGGLALMERCLKLAVWTSPIIVAIIAAASIKGL